MRLTGETLVVVSAEICARIANVLGILLETVPMWQFVTIAVSQGTLLQNAPPNHYVGTAVNLATRPATVRMKASAIHVVRPDILLENAALLLVT